MQRMISSVLLLAAILVLSACGGGSGGGATAPSGGGGGGFQPTPNIKVEIIPVSPSVPANIGGFPVFLGSPFFTQIDVEVTTNNGTAVADGTTVNLRVSPVQIGVLTKPNTEDDEDAFTTYAAGLFAETTGGFATFFFHGLQQGQATLTASVNATGTTAASDSFVMEVTEGFIPDFGNLITMTPDKTTLPAHLAINPMYPGDSPFMSTISVSVLDSFGSAPTESENEVVLTASPSDSGWVSTINDPDTDVNEFLPTGGFATGKLNGSSTIFFFHSRKSTGPVTVTATYTFPSCEGGSSSDCSPDAGRTVSQQIILNIVEGNEPPLEQLEFVAERTVMPVNFTEAYVPNTDLPYTASIVVAARQIDGQAIPVGTDVQGTIPIDGTGSISVLDDPETDEINEFTTHWGSITSGAGAGGQAQFFFHSGTKPGVATITASYLDPLSGKIVSGSLDITVVDSPSNGLPASISARTPNSGLYISGSGGASAKTAEITVLDAGNEPVQDPPIGDAVTAFNNVLVELIDTAGDDGESLSVVSAQGQSLQGRSVKSATVNGKLSVGIRSGDEPKNQLVKATADRADNNVDNGIQDPIEATFSVAISDGKLFGLRFVNPNVNAIKDNGADANVIFQTIDQYSLTVSVIGTDRLGNPVIPNTQIQFGLIDAPLVVGSFPMMGSGDFAVSGPNGNPAEGEHTFSSPGADFLNDGGGIGPGDSLVIFGEDSNGNRDLESWRLIQQINSATNLRVTSRFNLNDDTGNIVDNGPTLPYVIGRGTHGNILASASTDEFGFANTVMNFPASQLGRSVILFAQGNGELKEMNGDTFPKTIADIETFVYPGVGPLIFSRVTESLPPNSTTDTMLCVVDAAQNPVQGLFLDYVAQNPVGADITIDGVQGDSGTLSNATGADGCVVANIQTKGQIVGTSPGITINFGVGALSTPVTINAPSAAGQDLYVDPSLTVGGNIKHVIDLYLVDASGDPVEDVQIFLDGQCTVSGPAGAAIKELKPPGITDANGHTTVELSAVNLDDCTNPGSAECRFTTASNSTFGILKIFGVLKLPFSPIECGEIEEEEQFELNVGFGPGGFNPLDDVDPVNWGQINSVPAAILCPGNCTNDFAKDLGVFLQATPPAGGFIVDFWDGNVPECQVDVDNTDQIQVTMTQSITCLVEFCPDANNDQTCD